MRLSLILSVILLNISLACAQKRGFDDVFINNTLSIISALNKYQIAKGNTPGSFLINADSLRAFETAIDHLKVDVDERNLIKRITAYSKPVFFKNYTDWKSRINDLINYMNYDLRRKALPFHSHNPGKFAMGWWLKEHAVSLLMETQEPKDFISTDFFSTVTLTWIEDKTGGATVTY